MIPVIRSRLRAVREKAAALDGMLGNLPDLGPGEPLPEDVTLALARALVAVDQLGRRLNELGDDLADVSQRLVSPLFDQADRKKRRKSGG